MNPEFMREMSQLWIAAADEIERLRAERDRKNLTIQALTEERDEVVSISNKFKRQRDEARREICSTVVFPSSPREYATKRRGWDCFETEVDRA
jgi:hypothetical protein